MTPVGSPEPIGCIGAYWAEVRDPSRQELEALDAMARAAAVAFENLRLQRSLQETLQLARASDRAKSDFLANMSHEIRTPLNGVVGALGLLARTRLSDEQKRLVEMIRGSSEDLDGVLKAILDFARLQSEDAVIETAPFQLGEAVREVAQLFELRFARKGLDFRVEVDPAVDDWVAGDRGAVKQVLANLVHNALKFTKKGRAVLSAEPAGGDRIRFVVADTGLGVAEEVRERIFGRFEQGDASVTRPAGGVGLGLTIAKRLVELMDGDLSMESRLGAGSIFTVTVPLPAARAPAPPPVLAAVSPPAPEPEPTPEEPQAAKGPPRVLVVDDYPSNRILVSSLLSTIGAVSVEVEDGQQACEAFANGVFDAILMDIQMPVMDGFTATRKIREMEAERGGGRVPIIMLSANALPEHIEESRAVGADRHLAKPISAALLFSVLREATEGKLQAA
jgi:signal transduction histidine kinase/CheY-like chemotaxis protein